MGKLAKSSKHETSYRRSTIGEDYTNIINYIFILLISVFLIVIPFYRGLYFRENYIPSVIYISGIFIIYILYKLVKKDYKLINSYLDIAVLLMPVTYFISFFFSVNAKDAFDAVMKYTAYFMVYKIVSDLCRENKYKKVFEYTIIAALFAMAAACLMSAFGYVDIKGAMVGERIYGLYQYANATASALGAAIFMALGFSLNGNKIYEKVINNLVLATVFPVFILTLSRGAYIIFAALAVINIILLDARKRVQYVYSMVVLAAANGMFLFKYFGAENAGDSAVYFIGGVVAFLAFQLFYEKLLLKYIDRISIKAVNMVLISILIGSVISGIVLFGVKVPIEYKIEHISGEEKSWKGEILPIRNIMSNKEYTIQFLAKSNVESDIACRVIVASVNEVGEQVTIIDYYNSVGNELEQISHKFTTKSDTKSIMLKLYNYEANSYTIYKDIQVSDSEGNIVKRFDKLKYLPATLANRLADINLETHGASTRIYYFKDGMKIFKDNFLIGAGGGGWKSLYRKYQSLPYDSAEAHNFYLQYAIETGIIGILILLSIYFLVIKEVYISIFINRKNEHIPLNFAMFMLMGHAVLDFDLSLTALAFLFWIIVGMAGANDKQISDKLSANIVMRSLLSIITILVLFLSTLTYLGIKDGIKAVSLIKKDVESSIKLYESAMKKDPYNMNYQMDYMQIMYNQYVDKKDTSFLKKMQDSLSKVLESDIYDMKYGPIVVNIFTSTGDFDKAIEFTDKLVSSNPMISDAYMFKVNVNYQIANYYLSGKQKDKALPYLKNIIEAEKQFNEANERAAEPMKVPEKMDEMIKFSNDLVGVAVKQ